MHGLDLVIPPARTVRIAGGNYTALPLRLRDLRDLSAADDERRRRAFAPYREMLAIGLPDEGLRRALVREAIELLDGRPSEPAPADGAWLDLHLARVLRRSRPLPSDLAGRMTAGEWAEVLAIGQGLDPLDEVYQAIDGPPAAGAGTPWPKVFATLARAIPGLTPDAFGDLMLPQLRVYTSDGECEPGAPGGDEAEAMATLRRRHAFLCPASPE